MKHRPDLLTAESPRDIEVIQLTTEQNVPASHIYMEAQIFAPDSRRFLLHRSATPHGSDQHDPEHQYLVCDVESGCALLPLTRERGATAPSVTPDGRQVYYFVNCTRVGGGSLLLKRVGIDGSDRRTVMAVDADLPGTTFRPSSIYPLSTISSDGKRLAVSAYLGDGQTPDALFGLLVFDLERATVEVVIAGQSWCNMHPQYCRSCDPEAGHDILIQENHGNVHDARGGVVKLQGGAGADIHVIRDDGGNLRSLPWGRDGNEFCQGHQCWRGRGTWAITSTVTRDVGEEQLIESQPVASDVHIGLLTPGGVRNDLSRTFAKPLFSHFATDIQGQRLVTDAGPRDDGGRIFLADLGEPGCDPLLRCTFLVNPRSSWRKEAHIHPFLSPDGTMAFFNSDESGTLQAYMIRGLQGI
jgi:hypothetical protein